MKMNYIKYLQSKGFKEEQTDYENKVLLRLYPSKGVTVSAESYKGIYTLSVSYKGCGGSVLMQRPLKQLRKEHVIVSWLRLQKELQLITS